ncbi:MAG: hypothetical protein MJE68_13810 [Proteobacteria bacterium]|nr:hypothetical protein [Pseudomonadota bacterium]
MIFLPSTQLSTRKAYLTATPSNPGCPTTFPAPSSSGCPATTSSSTPTPSGCGCPPTHSSFRCPATMCGVGVGVGGVEADVGPAITLMGRVSAHCYN